MQLCRVIPTRFNGNVHDNAVTVIEPELPPERKPTETVVEPVSDAQAASAAKEVGYKHVSPKIARKKATLGKSVQQEGVAAQLLAHLMEQKGELELARKNLMLLIQGDGIVDANGKPVLPDAETQASLYKSVAEFAKVEQQACDTIMKFAQEMESNMKSKSANRPPPPGMVVQINNSVGSNKEPVP